MKKVNLILTVLLLAAGFAGEVAASELLRRISGAGLTGTAAVRPAEMPVLRSNPAGDAVTLYGDMFYSSAWDTSGDGEFGIYSIGTVQPVTYAAVAESPDFNLSSAAYADGLFCGYRTTQYNGQIYSITYYLMDSDGWTLEKKVKLPAEYRYYATSALAYDYSEKTVYGQFLTEDGEGLQLCKVDLLTGEPTAVAQMGTRLFYTFSFDNDGTLYGIAEDGVLYTVDKGSGKQTEVGATGVMPANAQSAAIDRKSGRMFWAAIDTKLKSGLYEVDKSTGKAELIGSFGGTVGFVGLYAEPFAASGVPAAVSDLRVEFAGEGALQGKIAFTAPEMSADGQPLQGGLTVNLLVDNKVVEPAVNTVEAGADYEAGYEFAEGLHKIQVYLTNGAGDGLKAKTTAFAGVDVPGAVENLTFGLAGNRAEVRWDAPAAGANGGYFDRSQLKYRVVRHPDNAVTENVTVTSFSETLPEVMANYYYEVTAIAGKDGVAAESNRILYGEPFETPYNEPFESADAFDLFTVAAANAGGAGWAWVNGAAASTADGTEAADDWLITPPVRLTSDYLYKLSFKTKGYGTYYKEHLQTAFGKENTVEGMAVALGDYTVSGDEYLEKSAVVEIAEDGTYHFGFRHCSSGAYYRVYVDDIAVEKFIPTSAPAQVDNYSVEADKGGALKVAVAFNAPTKAINGTPLTALDKIEIYCGNNLVHTENNAATGKAYSFTFDVKQGINTFNVIAYGENGRGRDAEKEVFAGTDIPQTVRNMNVRWDKDNDFAAVVTWDAPEEAGVNGGTIDTSALTYSYASFMFNMWIDMATGLKDNFYTMTAYPSAVQSYAQGAIKAVSAGGAGAYTPFGIMLGTPLDAPFAESFAGGSVATDTWSVGALEGNDGWSMSLDGSVAASDGDNGFALCRNANPGADDSRLESPIINISGLDNPVLELDVYREPGNNAELSVEVTDNGTVFNAVCEPVEIAGGNGWGKMIVPLADYKGRKRIQVGFRALLPDASSFVAIDNISIQSDDSGISNTVAGGRISGGAGFISVIGYEGLPVAVYTIDGKAVASVAAACGGETFRVDVPGLYVVRAGNAVGKVAVR